MIYDIIYAMPFSHDSSDFELCSVDRHFRFADGKVRLGRCFWHLLSPIRPKDELDRTDILYPLRCGESIKSRVEAAQAELLNPDGSIKDRCKGKVQR